MKRKIIMILTLLTLLAGCSKLILENPVVNVGPEEIIEMIDKEETFVFIIGANSCPYCAEYIDGPLQELYDKKELKFSYLDIDLPLDEEKMNLLVGDEKYVNKKLESTPTTYFVSEGKIVHVEEGVVAYDSLVKYYSDYIE